MIQDSTVNINNVFFKGSYKHAWKKIIPPGLTEAEVDFIEEMCGIKNSGHVLDLMCGYGRHSLELARRAITVTAIDNLAEYINEIKTAAQKENLKLNAIVDDVLTTQFPENGYDSTICMGNSFAFFDKNDALTILQKVASHLKRGGVFIINTWMIAEIAIKHFQSKSWHYAGEYKCILDYKYCFHPSRIESEQTVISPGGDVEILNGIDYIFTLDELEEMFKQTGLRTKELYSTPRKRKFNLGDTRIYIVAEKI
jgi:cyclopropane fatty-acyl-phospholipid synthase-like methyltransferase